MVFLSKPKQELSLFYMHSNFLNYNDVCFNLRMISEASTVIMDINNFPSSAELVSSTYSFITDTSAPILCGPNTEYNSISNSCDEKAPSDCIFYDSNTHSCASCSRSSTRVLLMSGGIQSCACLSNALDTGMAVCYTCNRYCDTCTVDGCTKCINNLNLNGTFCTCAQGNTFLVFVREVQQIY